MIDNSKVDIEIGVKNGKVLLGHESIGWLSWNREQALYVATLLVLMAQELPPADTTEEVPHGQ